MAFRAVMFDLDGTLVATLPGIVDAVNLTLKEHGLDRRFDSITGKRLIGGGAVELARRSAEGLGLSAKRFQDYALDMQRNYHRMQISGASAFPGVKDLLVTFKEKGIPCFVATNKPSGLAREVIVALYGPHFFREIVGPSDGFPLKPDGAMIDYLADKFHLDKDRILYVGDSYYDVDFAHNAGVRTALVGWGYGDYSGDLPRRADYFVKDARELRKIVLGA